MCPFKKNLKKLSDEFIIVNNCSKEIAKSKAIKTDLRMVYWVFTFKRFNCINKFYANFNSKGDL